MLQQEVKQLKNRCSRIENQGKQLVEEVNGGDNLIDSENTDLARRATHIHGRMELGWVCQILLLWKHRNLKM
jgi:hypothetical protein